MWNWKATYILVTLCIHLQIVIMWLLFNEEGSSCLLFLLQAQHERQENSILKAENEKLQAENSRYREALASATCPNCGGPAAIGEMSFDEQHLRIENARLREEVCNESGRVFLKFIIKFD